MKYAHPAHPGRPLRLGYCTNLHAAERLDELYEGLTNITLPLRDRLLAKDASTSFGVGLYLAAELAFELAAPEGAYALSQLTDFLSQERLDPFTFNAFPFGGFHSKRLKADVFRPTWREEKRVEYTLAVAKIADHLWRELESDATHVSISTHCGSYGADWRGDEDIEACGANLRHVADELAKKTERGGPTLVLSLEPEPRSSANDLGELATLIPRLRAGQAKTHFGTCLDACHAAVEFEHPAEALSHDELRPFGKLQFSSAISLHHPGQARGWRQLLALDEPRYLHQVTARTLHGELLRTDDLPSIAKPGPEWIEAAEWRCHFHVPVDRTELAGSPLTTTRAVADELLTLLGAAPESWGIEELHVEIETYTWDLLSAPARGPGELVDGLEREYRHVMQLLERQGWQRG